MNAYEKLLHCKEQVARRLKETPRVGIVLGSGLGALADQVEDPAFIPYATIDGFPTSTAPGHVGRFVAGRLSGVPVILMQGRIHLYEGYPVSDCVLPARLMGLLGVQAIVLTNAAGACNPDYQVGDFCLLKDHISAMVPSPLIGPNPSELGTRFPDMTEAYDPGLRRWMTEAAAKADCVMHEGVYMQFTGPQYETPAEIRMAQVLGADMVGMSTVIEAVAVHHMGIPLAAVSLATNKAAGLGGKLSEEEVIEEGNRAAEKFRTMILYFLSHFAG